MKGRVTLGATALRGRRLRSLSGSRRNSIGIRQGGAAIVATALALYSGGIIGHALSISSTSLMSATNPSVWGQPVVFTATITPLAPAPTGTVTFQDGGAGIAGCVNRAVAARIATCTTAALAVGSHTITAVYSGNATYATSTSSPVTQVVGAGSTTSVVVSSVNPSVSGQTVTFTATVGAVAPASGVRTGTVAFQDGGAAIAGCAAKVVAAAGTATCAIAYAGPGTHPITALYSGDANFSGSTAVGVTQTVNLGTTAVVLSSSANPSSTGANVTFTANVTATVPASGTRTGTVDFQVGGVNIPGCAAQVVPVSGKATCVTNTMAVGPNTITAVFSGDANFAANTSAPFTQTVNQGLTTTKVVSSLNPSSTGISVTFTATVTAIAPAAGVRTGSVAFEDGGAPIAGCAAQLLAAAGTATCATSALAAGIHTITAIYSGDGNFTTSTSAPLAQTVVSTTTTTVTSSANPAVFGQAVQYTAIVAGGPTVTGTITFRDGGANIAGCVAVVMTAGSASCTVSPTVASHKITAVYSGDASNAASTSAVMTQVVTADPTTTVVTASVNPTVVGESVTFTATVTANSPGSGTPTGKLAFHNGAAAIAGCAGVTLAAGIATCTTTVLTVGVHSISGVYTGSATYLVSTSPVLTETVNAGSTTTLVGASLNPSVSGQTVTYTATVTITAPAAGAPTGKVDFQDGGVTIAGCGATALSAAATATCAITYFGAGTHSIIAIYSGDTNFAGSTSPVFTENVNQASTTTAVVSSVNPSVPGQPVTLTATVMVIAPGAGMPTGTVVFEDGGVTITGCVAQAVSALGSAVCAASFGSATGHAITAVYSGDASFGGSTSPALTETVNQGATATVVTSSVNPSVPGQPAIYTAVVTPTAPSAGTPTGLVAFADGGIAIGACASVPLVGGVASCATVYASVGTHLITAVYSGDANFSASLSPILTQAVDPGATSTAVTSSSDPSVSGENVTYIATVTALAPASGVPTGIATFMDGVTSIAGCGAQPVIGGVAVCGVAYAGAGSHAITAVYSGDANFTASTSPTVTQIVNPAATSNSLTSSVNPSVTGETVTVTATLTVTAPGSGIPTGTVAFLDNGTTIPLCAAQAVSGAGTAACDDAFAAAGTETITAVYSGDADFSSSTSAPLTQVINPGATSTGISATVNPSVSGEGLSYIVSVTAVAPAAGMPTGSVAFLDGGSSVAGCAAQPLVAGVASCSVTYAGVGAHSITAAYSGDANFTASTSPILLQTVTPASTSTSLAASVNPSVTGQPVTITATVSVNAPGSGTPSGTMSFQDDGTTISGCAAQVVTVLGTATCADAFAATGTETLTAFYSGDANFLLSGSPVLTQTINQGATATTVISSVQPSVPGEAISYSAIVTAVAPAAGIPTGRVAFFDGAAIIAGCGAQPLVGGMASCAVTYAGAGSHAITAVYSGDPDYFTSTSAVLTQTVNPGATSTSLASSANPSVPGQSVTITATVTVSAPGSGAPSGTVSFEDAGTTISGCAAQVVTAAGTATCTDAFAIAGVDSITAVYGGDPNFSTSTSSAFMQTINQGATAAGVTSSRNPSVPGEGVSFTVTVSAAAPASGTPTGTVAFLNGASTVAGCAAQPFVSGMASCNVVYPGVGAHTIIAVYSGDANFAGSSSAPFMQKVVMAASVTTLTSPSSVSELGQDGIFTATVAPAGAARVTPRGTAAFTDAGHPVAGCSAQPVVSGIATCRVVYESTGMHAIAAVYSGDAALTGSRSPVLVMSVYEDAPVPDAGAQHPASTTWGYVAILGGVFLVFLMGCVRVRRRNMDGE
jgi:large repetitive protein